MISMVQHPASGNVEIQKDGNRILFLNPKEYRDLIECMFPTIGPILSKEFADNKIDLKPGFLKSLLSAVFPPKPKA